MEKYTPTPEEKAMLHEKQLLKDAEFVKGGAKFKPGIDGEPILNLTENQQKEIQWRDAPESLPETYTLFKIINNLPGSKSCVVDPHVMDRKIFNTAYDDKGRRTDRVDGEYAEVSLDGGPYSIEMGVHRRPYIKIKRTQVGPIGFLGTPLRDVGLRDAGSVICYSLQEFYDNLKPEEREKGEAWGKELEGYLEE